MAHQGLATLALACQPAAARYGAVELNRQGQIVAFQEKALTPQIAGCGSELVNGGVYLLRKEFLDLIDAGKPVSLEREIFPMLAGTELFGFATDGYFVDIGVPEDLQRAQTELPLRFPI